MTDSDKLKFLNLGDQSLYVNLEGEPRPKLAAKIQAFKAAQSVTPGFYYLEIRHDDWCPCLTKGEDCECSPDFELYRPKK